MSLCSCAPTHLMTVSWILSKMGRTLRPPRVGSQWYHRIGTTTLAMPLRSRRWQSFSKALASVANLKQSSTAVDACVSRRSRLCGKVRMRGAGCMTASNTHTLQSVCVLGVVPEQQFFIVVVHDVCGSHLSVRPRGLQMQVQVWSHLTVPQQGRYEIQPSPPDPPALQLE